MKTISILDWPTKRFYSETHPFYKWKNEFKDRGLNVKVHADHRSIKYQETDVLIIHSRYFENGWQNVLKRNTQNTEELLSYLQHVKKYVNKLIWYDAADSTGSADFPIIPYVDVFLKKQVLKDLNYYTESSGDRKLRIWISEFAEGDPISTFTPCPKAQLHKIRLGWNIGLNDYRYFGYKLSRLSNYLSYRLYPAWFTNVESSRLLDLTFRGTVQKDNKHSVSTQRNTVFKVLNSLNFNIATGAPISKNDYRKELMNSKVSVSPYGWGEVCYRDFESVMAGTLLIKPSMEHLETFPNIYQPDETYVPVSWELDDLEEKLELVLEHYQAYKTIAENAQVSYKNVVSNPEVFINAVQNMIA